MGVSRMIQTASVVRAQGLLGIGTRLRVPSPSTANPLRHPVFQRLGIVTEHNEMARGLADPGLLQVQ